ncbi:hypothetical protein QTH11_03585 [Clostridium perfringens]|nr:hypothetical protein [Clostridium perfringens]MDK0640425.1 hypothetical protein [Clostridium perfringens]MDK0664238.1 hypothetical protein [Clostridium perfringens]MDK0982299.1 hypothetical protein [Clostridium perfringens]MDM0465534.1 hypothetical protein [Clostridium perfringens]
MSLRVKVEKVKFDNKDMYMVCDMKAINEFKELTGKSILSGINQMKDGNIDEITLFFLIASCLRKDPNGEPIGKELEVYNPIAVVAELGEKLTKVLVGAMPKGNNKKKFNKKK